MAGSTVVGSLLVQMGLDSAQFERNTGRVQSKVAEMAKRFDVSSKEITAAAAKMNLSVARFGNQMAAVQERVNPAAKALANYRQEAGLLKEALRLGAISQEQFRSELRMTIQSYRSTGQAVTASSGAMRSGMQQLGYQISDVAAMWGSGSKPMQIFSSQAGQVVQAIALMTNGTGKFGAFMAGPWGAAITAGVVVLGTLMSGMLDTGAAAKNAEAKTYDFSDGLDVLKLAADDAIDALTQLEQQIKSTIQVQGTFLATNSRVANQSVAALEGQISGLNSEISKLQKSQVFGLDTVLGLDPLANKLKSLKAHLAELTTALGHARKAATGAAIANSQVTALGKLDPSVKANNEYTEAVGRLQKRFEQSRDDPVGAQLAGTYLTQAQYQAEFQRLTSEKNTRVEAARQADKTGRTRSGGKGRAGKTEDQRDDAYLDAMDRLNNERLSLEASYTQSIQARYDAQIAEIDSDLEAYKRNVELNKDLTPERKQTLINTAAQNAQIKRDRAQSERQQALDIQAFELRKTALQEQIEQVELQQQLTASTEKRRDLDLQLLDLQDQLKDLQYDQVMANNPAGTTEWSNAFSGKQALQNTYSQRRQVVENQNLSPLQSYTQGLQTTVENINDAMESIQVEALDSLTNGIAGAIAGTQKLGDVFKNVAQQIIADLIKIQIQKAIVGALGNVLGGGSSTLSSTSLAGAGSYDYSAISGISIAGARANGGPISAGLPYLVGERGPEIVVPGNSGQVIPNHELSELGGGSSSVQIVPSKYFDVVVDQRASNVAAPMSIAAGVQARSAATGDVARARRRRIP